MRNEARPAVRAQIHPKALAIVEDYFAIPEGYTNDGAPIFNGIPAHVWTALEGDARFGELLAILSTDYPTFAALVQKIWAKRVGRLLPFIFNRTQILAWREITSRIERKLVLFIVFFKARQMGISTLVNGMAHWHVWRLHDIEVTLVAHEKPLVYSFVDRLRIFHEELPQVAGIIRHLRQPSKEARVPRDDLYYRETRSKIATVVAKNAEARGRSAPHYHLAEYAFYDKASELLSAIMPQLPAAGTEARLQCSLIVESTANGKNDFYTLWQHACSEASEWSAQFFPWYVQEDEYSLAPPADWQPSKEQREWAKRLAHQRKAIDGIGTISTWQIYWYEQTLESECEGDQDRMDREYPSDSETAFLLRSRSIFKDNMRYLQACVVDAQRAAPVEFRKRNLECPGNFIRGRMEYDTFDNPFAMRMPTFSQLRLRPKFKTDPKGSLWVWSPPQPEHEYVIGIDAAAGTFAGDYSCGEVLDITEGKQVAELWYKAAPELLTDDCVALGWWYNTALLYPEINSIGVVCMKRAKQVWQYPRVGREEKWDEIGTKANKYGHYTTWESKQIMISFYKHVVEEQHLAIASDGLLAEMSTFIETAGGDFEGDSGSHDDRVMAMALALAVVRQSPRMLAGFSKVHTPRQPNAVDAMINAAPALAQDANGVIEGKTATERQRVPDEVRKLLDGVDILAVPSNPIRGVGIELPW